MVAGNFGSPMQLIILLAIVLLLFGGKRLRNLGGDLGSAIKGFKEATATPKHESATHALIPTEQEPAPSLETAQREKSHSHGG